LAGIATYQKDFKRLNKKDLITVSLLGIIGVFINQWTFFVGLETADPTTSALILATTPILTGFLAAVFLKEKWSLRMLFGSIYAIMGFYFVVPTGCLSSLSIDKVFFWIVLTMVTFSIISIITRVLSRRLDPPIFFIFSDIVGFIASFPLVF